MGISDLALGIEIQRLASRPYDFGGESGTRTLDLGIMSAGLPLVQIAFDTKRRGNSMRGHNLKAAGQEVTAKKTHWRRHIGDKPVLPRAKPLNCLAKRT
jgi:hypothetical protein